MIVTIEKYGNHLGYEKNHTAKRSDFLYFTSIEELFSLFYFL